MRTLLLTLSCLFALSVSAGKVKVPTKAKVLESMELANDYFIHKYPDAGAPTYEIGRAHV